MFCLTRIAGGKGRRHVFLRHFLGLALMAPMVLSPTHPVAVYGYLADTLASRLVNLAYASVDTGMVEFLTSSRQIDRYKWDLREDTLNENTGFLFVIVLRDDGTLYQEAIRTWNGFLPEGMPAGVSAWLDRKEIPYLGDEVGVWLHGGRIAATGHYHCYGGEPSRGDLRAQQFSGVPEVVVSNGIFPRVYLDGKLLPYGHNVHISPSVFRSLRALDRNLAGDTSQVYTLPGKPTETITSYLGYLKDFRHVDISSVGAVADETTRLCADFETDYIRVFPKGFLLYPYLNDTDAYCFVSNFQNIRGWADINRSKCLAE